MDLENNIKLFESFAGYGGASFALKKLGINYDVTGISEVDKDALELFNLNFPNVKNYGNIEKINPNDLPDFNLFTGGFPCQPFSTVGKRLGELDTRGTLFSYIINICEIKKPKFILLENVKGLSQGKQKPTFQKILNELKRIGYDTRYSILNSKDYGVPQNRERLWIFGYLGELPLNFDIIPPQIKLVKKLKDFLDIKPDLDLYRTKEQIERIKFLHNIKDFNVNKPLCYDYYNRKLRTDEICMTITPPEHNVLRIIEPIINGIERVRKLSLNEHFRLMGFEMKENYQEIKFPLNQTYSKLGKRAGNGWDVNLVSHIFKHIFKNINVVDDKREI